MDTTPQQKAGEKCGLVDDLFTGGKYEPHHEPEQADAGCDHER
jgi:hypothetical protein